MKNKFVLYLGILVFASACGFAAYAQMPKMNAGGNNSTFEVCGDKIPSKIRLQEDFINDQCASAVKLGKNPYNIKTISVSYTHLDVYKRQSLCRIYYTYSLRHFLVCLLYTSRCV